MKDESKRSGIFNIAAFSLVLAAGAFSVFSQTTEVAKTEPVKTEAVKNEAVTTEVQPTEKSAALMPLLTEYKQIKIGMTADEVRDKLDKKPEVADKDGFFYRFSDSESAQIMLDAEKKVRVIVVMYADRNGSAPKYADVFGALVPVSEMPDGRVYNLVRYPDAGYWVAYNRTAGENPMVTVTIQKL